MSFHIKLSLAALTTAALTVTAAAQTPSPVHWTGTATKSATPGAQTSVKLSAKIDAGWHIYSITQGPGGPFPTKVTVPDSQSFALAGTVKAVNAPDVAFDQSFGINVETYENKADFTVPVKVASNAKPGKQDVVVSARYQVCNASMCLPPRTEKVSVPVTVTGKAGK